MPSRPLALSTPLLLLTYVNTARQNFGFRASAPSPVRKTTNNALKAVQWAGQSYAMRRSKMVFSDVKIFYHEIWRLRYFFVPLPCTWEGTWRVKAAAQHSSSELGSAFALHFTCSAKGWRFLPRRQGNVWTPKLESINLKTNQLKN